MTKLIALLVACIAATRILAADPQAEEVPPEPAPGQSLGAWIDALFADEEESSNVATPGSQKDKRYYYQATGLHESVWEDEETNTYNITTDMSACEHGIKMDTKIGKYTFLDGSTQSNVTAKEISEDIFLMHGWYKGHGGNPAYANHTAYNAMTLLEEISSLMNTQQWICLPDSNTPNTAIDLIVNNAVNRQSTRGLLASNASAWFTLLATTVIGGILGAGLAAMNDLIFEKGNLSDRVRPGHVLEVAEVVAITGLSAGILSRMHEVGHIDSAGRRASAAGRRASAAGAAAGGAAVAIGANARDQAVAIGGNALDRAANVANAAQVAATNAVNQAVPGGSEAIANNLFIAWARALIESLAQAAVERVARPLFGTGQTNPASGAAAANLQTFPPCISAAEAAAAAAELRNVPPGHIELQPFNDFSRQVAESGALLDQCAADNV